MTQSQLVAHFNRVSDSAEAVPLLRRFVLDLAVRGRLVVQDPVDEPASQLLKHIEAERARLFDAGEIRKVTPLPPVKLDEISFEVPAGWEWVRIRQVTTDRGQVTPDRTFTYIDVTAIDKDLGRITNPKILSPSEAPSRARKLVRTGDVIYSCVRPYLLNIAIIEQDIAPAPIASTAFAVLNGFGLVLAKYLWIVLRSPFMVECVEGKMRGQAYPAINDSDFALLPFPLPPLAEQHRIVTKTDELIMQCDQLQTAYTEQETRRDALTDGLLNRINESASADQFAFRAYIQFQLDHFRQLTARPKQIQQLRETLLDVAMRGQLVVKDPNDYSSSRLLNRIQVDKTQLVKSGDIKKDKPLSPLAREHAPFEIPAGWEWIRLGEIAEVITKGSSPKWQGIEYVSKESGILFVTSENVGNYSLRKMDEPKYVARRFNEIEPRSILQHGDILMNLVGASIGRTAIYDLPDEANINQAVAVIRLVRTMPDTYRKFLLHYLNSPLAIKLMLASRVVTAQPNISLTDVREFPVPTPPLAEQQRIVEKVEELQYLCEQFDVQIRRQQTESHRLFKLILTEALGTMHYPVIKKNSMVGHEGSVIEEASDTTRFKEHITLNGKPNAMNSNPVETIEQMVECLVGLGGSATPERLLRECGLGDDVEKFFDLLREGRNSGVLNVPTGPNQVVRRASRAN
jgi:type I restriction enzyme S subunit